ncbi:MAG TPA: hypothetical protein VF231_11245 [Candidatus Limnocylindrales bacterium]
MWPIFQRQASSVLAVSRVMLLRSTARTRDLARTFAATMRAAYPADAIDIRRALTDPAAQWPGDGILWARVEGTQTTILNGVPRGVG